MRGFQQEDGDKTVRCYTETRGDQGRAFGVLQHEPENVEERRMEKLMSGEWGAGPGDAGNTGRTRLFSGIEDPRE